MSVKQRHSDVLEMQNKRLRQANSALDVMFLFSCGQTGRGRWTWFLDLAVLLVICFQCDDKRGLVSHRY